MLAKISTVTVFGLSAQLFGFLRMAIIAYTFGLSAQVDAYYLGLAIPSLLALVFANWLQLTFLGRYTTLLIQDQPASAHTFKMTMLLLGALVATLVCLFGVTFPEATVGLFLPGHSSEAATAATAFSYLILMLVPTVIADFMGQTLNGHGRFALAAIAPFMNAVVATAALWLWPTTGLESLVGSLLMGSIAQLCVVLVPFINLSRGQRIDTVSIRPELNSVLKLTAYIVPAVLLSNAMLSVLQFSTAQLEQGSVATMGFANRINGGFAQLLVMGLSTVLLPQFAALAAQAETAATLHLFRRLIRGSFVVCSTLAAFIYLFGEPFVALFLARGAFAGADATSVAHLLFILSLSLLPLSIGTFIARYFSALRRADLLLWSGLISFCCVLAVSMVGVSQRDMAVIALAPAVAYTGTAAFWLWALSSTFAVRRIARDAMQALVRITITVAPAVGVDYYLVSITGASDDFSTTIVRACVFAAIVGLLVFFGGTMRWLLDPYQADSGERP